MQLILVSILDRPMTHLNNILKYYDDSFDLKSFCAVTSSTTSLAARATRGNSQPSRAAANLLATITATERHRRSISSTCWSIRHRPEKSFSEIYNGYNYLLFVSSWCILSVIVYSVLWHLRLPGYPHLISLWIIVAGNLLTIIFLLTALGVGASQTALPFWPWALIML